MKTTDNTIPSFATHPGEILIDELNAAEISQVNFAKQIGFKNKSQLNEIIKGKRAINAELAILLEGILGIDANYWLNAQNNYDLDLARIKQKNQHRLEAIKQWGLIKNHIGAKFLRKQKEITGDPVVDIPIVKTIYGVKNFEGLANIAAQPIFSRFKKSTKLNVDTVNLIAWVKLVQYKAKKETVREFDHDNKLELIERLKVVLAKNVNTKTRVKQTLSDFGIKLIYQDKGERTPVDGISFWSNGKPAIGMTLRHKRLDNFAFTLFHELGHVYEHLVNSNNAEFIDLEKNYEKSQEEKEANQFAQDHLINQEKFSQLNNFSDKSIIEFAKQNGMHPSIVLGRVSYEQNFYGRKTSIERHIN